MSTALAVPISTTDAPLPQRYEAAKLALANCTQVDECQDWADKAAALASYARQQNDNTLRDYALRIQARATRRVGELLKQFDGRGRPPENSGGAPTILPLSQRQAAEAAGLSKDRQVTAVRVANVPEEVFTAAVETPRPATVTALSELGKRVLSEPKPAGFHEATHTIGAMRRFVEKCREHEPELIAGGVADYELEEVREYVAVLDRWLDRFVVNLRG